MYPTYSAGGKNGGKKSNIENWNQGPTSCSGFANDTAMAVLISPATQNYGENVTEPGTLTRMLWPPAPPCLYKVTLGPGLTRDHSDLPGFVLGTPIPHLLWVLCNPNAISKTACPAEETLVL